MAPARRLAAPGTFADIGPLPIMPRKPPGVRRPSGILEDTRVYPRPPLGFPALPPAPILPPTPALLLALVGALAAACAPATPPAADAPAPELAPDLPVEPGAVMSAPEPDPVEAGRAPLPGEYAGAFDVLHYDLELSLHEGRREIAARARTRVAPPADPDTPMEFDLVGLAVHAVEVEGVRTPFEYADGKLRVFAPPNATGPVTVEVAYGGTPDDGLILRDNVHGDPAAFADNWPNRARFWFPSVDHPSDKATVEYTIHAPAAWQVIANGTIAAPPAPTTDDALGGAEGRRTWRWTTSVPIPSYTMVVGGADLAVRQVGLAACDDSPVSPRSDGCTRVTYWVYPQDTGNAARIFRRAAEMVDFFTDLIGPYPYEKLANVQSATRFGGMENSSAIFYSEQGIAAGRDMEGTVSHEIAHQWFGDSVTESEWYDLWLSEGFATYFGALFFEEADGRASFRGRMESGRQRVLNSSDVNRPVVDPEETNLFNLLNANNYPKGGWVLHMLRGMLGDEVFFAGIRGYYARFRDGVASTSDFRAVMEETSGTDLGWFFEQWLYRPGYPVVTSETRWDAEAGEAVVTLRQTQRMDWPVFRLPLDIEFDVGGNAQRREIEMTDREQVFRVPLPGAPSSTTLDPDDFVLMRTDGN